MQQSFYSSLSGASTHQNGLATWANNLANINTAGFRSDIVEFKSLVSDSVRNNGQVNSSAIDKKDFGVTAVPSKTNFSQSSIVNTDNEFDLSIQGNGFFVVGDNAGKTKYTRDGSFTKDRDGFLVNSSGYYLKGVNLGKVNKDNNFNPKATDDDLKTQDIKKLTNIKIPSGTVYKPKQTTKVDMAINLNAKKNITSLNQAYNGLLYGNDTTIIQSRPLSEFIDIKNGDIFQVNTNKQQGKAYIYGTDFTTIKELQAKFIKNREDISFGLESGLMTFTNTSGEKLDIDYKGSSDEVKNALSLQDNAVLGKGSKLRLAPLTQKQQYNTNFNTLNAKNEFLVNIKKGDDISVKINGVTHKMVYGSSEGFNSGGKEIPKEDSFLTIKDFIDKLEKKSNLEITMEGSRIKFTNKESSTIDFKVTSSNATLIGDLGIPPSSSLAPGLSATSYPLGVASYTNTISIYDQVGKKYNVRAHYVAQSSIGENSQEKWHASLSLYDGDRLVSDKNTYGNISFSNDGAKVSTSSINIKDGTKKEVDSFSIDFPGNKALAVNLKNDGNGKPSTNFQYLDSSISGNKIDGNQKGVITGVVIDDAGKIIVNFSNEKQSVYGRVGLVDFVNKNGLRKSGNNMFEDSYVTGKEGVKYPATGGAYVLWDKEGNTYSSIGQRSLETSNADLTKGLTELIVMQRSFAANAKAISTSDEMTQQAINLKG